MSRPTSVLVDITQTLEMKMSRWMQIAQRSPNVTDRCSNHRKAHRRDLGLGLVELIWLAIFLTSEATVLLLVAVGCCVLIAS